jgi:hypothetical protein
LIECETGWKRYGNKCYKAFSTNTGVTWTEAKSNCANQNYTLASVFNKAIFDFLLVQIVNQASDLVWVGAWRETSSSTFKWIDNSTYTSFYTIDPPNDSTKNWLTMEKLKTFFLALTASDNKKDYMCEYTI